ncbi:hypothetical protein GB931_03075 [Modestobacter sp. I12A-02628]|uniref:Bleomycin resistance protein n=1 Tax=Goekera deserti TaxID=2497753 RepID=A0A7K3WCY5_9ACTN|nr:VOC family protein [Goekera deserti]MPQ96920.1 hypothetical protein [Goekera deserti]NDI46766.1 hypothetical protein [Goekera deserti]NEL54335.1 hypothetical protein [Goekera deserti]
MSLLSAVPALPAADIKRAVQHYVDKFGFEARYVDDDYGVVGRDRVEIHLWPANKPDTAGAEPFIAGTASCRIEVEDVEGLYSELRAKEVIHENGALDDGPWGREFTTLDADCNAVTFYQSERQGPS